MYSIGFEQRIRFREHMKIASGGGFFRLRRGLCRFAKSTAVRHTDWQSGHLVAGGRQALTAATDVNDSQQTAA